MEWIEAKKLLYPVTKGDDWFGIVYNMNVYRGCNHGCIYCDSRSACYHVEHFDQVRAKQNVPLLLERELASKRKRGIVGIGSMSDPYNVFEKKYELTRKTLLLLEKYGYGVCMQTKGEGILRDIDVLQNIQKRASACIGVTITTYDDGLARKIEPFAPSSSKRFEVVHSLAQAGIFVGIVMSPVLPLITDTEDNIKRMVFLAHQSGARFVYTYLGVTLRENQRAYYYTKLSQAFPGLPQKYQKMYGDRYLCVTPHKRLWNTFVRECEKYGILYKMEDIIAVYKKENTQISFFHDEKMIQ